MPREPCTVAAFIVLPLLLMMGLAQAWPLEMPVVRRAGLVTLLESTALAADVNADGLDEIVAAGREELYVLGVTGRVLWQWRTKGRFMTDPAVFHVPDERTLLYAADSQGLFTCLDGTGNVVWQAQLKGPLVWSGPVAGVREAGAEPVVIQTDNTGGIWAFGHADGRGLWQARVTGAQ